MATANVIPMIQSGNGAVNVQDVSNLADKTVFIKVRFGSIGNSRKVSNTVLETDADKSLLKVSKTLLDSKELEAIKTADGHMRQYLYQTCLPYDIGIMLLPVGLITQVQSKLAEYKAERAALVSALVSAYPSLCASASVRLGSLYNPLEYPSAETVAAKFVFEWQFVSFGVPSQLKGISAALFNAEKEKAADAMKAATEEITLLMRSTLLEMVSHLSDRLASGPDGKPKILRETAITNLQEFLKTFDLRNVTDDKELSQIVQKTRALISGTNADALRNSDVFRDKIRAGMTEITGSLSGMVEEKAGRKFKDV